MAIEIVDLPIKNGGSFQFATLVYRRVPNIMTHMCPPTQGSSGMARYSMGRMGLKRSTNAARKIDDATIFWFVVWNMNFIFPYIGNFIIPTDELHHFSEG